MSKSKLWRWYYNLFIRTPIAALLFIMALVVGLTLLASTITVRQYASVQAEAVDGKDGTGGTLLAAKLDRTSAAADLHVGDAVVWYVESSGERYDGEIASIESAGEGSSVHIRTDREQWNDAVNEAGTNIKAVTVDLPVARMSVREKLLGSKGGDAQ
jgi:hypothetical protein